MKCSSRRWRTSRVRRASISPSSRRSLSSFALTMRRSISSCCSPGPRVPTPTGAPPVTWPRWLHMARRRGAVYSSCAISTWSCACLVVARLAKMSRITSLRSMTLTASSFSSSWIWLGASSLSKITTLAPSSLHMAASSSTLPLPMYVLPRGATRRCSSVPTTRTPAVSASALSSMRDSSSPPSSSRRRTPTRIAGSARMSISACRPVSMERRL